MSDEEDQAHSLRSGSELAAIFERVTGNEEANALCALAGLSKLGNTSAKRGRFLKFVSGPAARQRPGWADLLWRVFDARRVVFSGRQ